jgi:predicted dehydrogenase
MKLQAILFGVVVVIGFAILGTFRLLSPDENSKSAKQEQNLGYHSGENLHPSNPKLSPTPLPSPDTSIHKIDFGNFIYPAEPIFPEKGKFTFRNGKNEDENFLVVISYLEYSDVTGDGDEEAIVVLGYSTQGTATYKTVYIYTLEKGEPELLWAFNTGDRADGGLRRTIGENGTLLVELYGKGTTPKDLSNKEESGACCPISFTRTRYQWNGKHFQQKGKEETLPNPSGGATVIMTAYK